MPNIYKQRNKLNQLALKKQKEFPEVVECIKPLYSPKNPEYISLNVGEKVNLKRFPSASSKDTLYTFGFVSNAEHDNVDLFFLTEDEVREYFDVSEIEKRGLQISDAPTETDFGMALSQLKQN